MKPPTQKTAVGFDPEKYAHHVAGLDLTAEQQDELIRAIANIMLAFVDLGFGISPTQTPCGERDLLEHFLTKASENLIECEHPETDNARVHELFSQGTEKEDS